MFMCGRNILEGVFIFNALTLVSLFKLRNEQKHDKNLLSQANHQ